MRHLRVVAIAIPILMFGFVNTNAQQGEEGTTKDIFEGEFYYCPPCGCSSDHIRFYTKDQCPDCSMSLISSKQGISGKLAFYSSDLFRNNEQQSKYYTKFAYPAFFVGLLLGLLSLFNQKKSSLNIFLNILILVLALYGFKNQLFGVTYGLTNDFRMLFLPISFILLMGPFYYFYLASTTGGLKWKNRLLLHFFPGFLVFLVYAILFLSNEQVKRSFMMSPYDTMFSHAEQLGALIFGFIYWIAGNIKFRTWKNSLVNGFYDGEVKWIRRFQFGFLLLLLLWSAHLILNYFVFELGVTTQTYLPLWLGIAVFIYWVGLEILANPKFFLLKNGIKGANGQRNITIKKLEAYKHSLMEVMRFKKPYLDPNLSLNKLAEFLEINPKDLSIILNAGFQQNFYDFINEYRIEEVKQQLLNPQNSHLTIVGIASQAGFNSKSSFNALFKKHMKMTPKDFMKHQH